MRVCLSVCANVAVSLPVCDCVMSVAVFVAVFDPSVHASVWLGARLFCVVCLPTYLPT